MGEALFVLMIISSTEPKMTVPLATFDSALRCFSIMEAIKKGAVSMHPELDLVCKQTGLPDKELEPQE